MTEKILLVDDDENLLRGCERGLRKVFAVETATGPEAGLERLRDHGPYAVVVSDMRMPGMDGVTLLQRAREIAPDTVRMMLTGNTDLLTAVRAVNDGAVFRFLTKPCETDELARMISAGLHQHRLIRAERELLESTLNGAIGLCTEILAAVDPRLSGVAAKTKELAVALGRRAGLRDVWELELAALLARIGRATIPPVVVVREREGKALTGVEKDMLARVPQIGHGLLAKIPRLEGVARIVLYAEKAFDGSGFPKDDVAGERLPVEARLIRIAADLAWQESLGQGRFEALRQLKARDGQHDPALLALAFALWCSAPQAPEAGAGVRALRMPELVLGGMLQSDLETVDGVLLVPSGTVLTKTLLERLQNFAKIHQIKEPLLVMLPSNAPAGTAVAAAAV